MNKIVSACYRKDGNIQTKQIAQVNVFCSWDTTTKKALCLVTDRMHLIKEEPAEELPQKMVRHGNQYCQLSLLHQSSQRCYSLDGRMV